MYHWYVCPEALFSYLYNLYQSIGLKRLAGLQCCWEVVCFYWLWAIPCPPNDLVCTWVSHLLTHLFWIVLDSRLDTYMFMYTLCTLCHLYCSNVHVHILSMIIMCILHSVYILVSTFHWCWFHTSGGTSKQVYRLFIWSVASRRSISPIRYAIEAKWSVCHREFWSQEMDVIIGEINGNHLNLIKPVCTWSFVTVILWSLGKWATQKTIPEKRQQTRSNCILIIVVTWSKLVCLEDYDKELLLQVFS